MKLEAIFQVEMKRRQFIKCTALLSAGAVLSRRGLSKDGFPQGASQMMGDQGPFQHLDHSYLTDFESAQDEGPILFGNYRDSWLATLRRLNYPEDRESISLFQLQGEHWTETNPVTAEPGQYEALAADCVPDGAPLLAWTEIKNHEWLIKAATGKSSGFEPAVTISTPSHRAINPVVKAFGPHDYVVAWEEFAQGKFTVWMARLTDGHWSQPSQAIAGEPSCFEPALEVGSGGEVYLSYSCTDGVHRDIYMAIFEPKTMRKIANVPIAIGGGLVDRVNINGKSNLAFDRSGNLWISWESNRFTTRLNDSDCYTGDRCCAMVCYRDGKLYEPKESGRWLFQGQNDHLPTFHKDHNNNLFVLTHCGGGYDGERVNPSYWSFRASYLDPVKGWMPPVTLLNTNQKGPQLRPSILFAADAMAFWMVWKTDERREIPWHRPEEAGTEMIAARRGQLEMEKFAAPRPADSECKLDLIPTAVEEYHPIENFHPYISGRLRIPRHKVNYKGQTYTLLLGNLHEHSEHSDCWPAGTDGTFHDDYRYGLFSEGYDFMGITDHGYQINEVYWRKCLRMADFYNDPEYFVGLPAVEWTRPNDDHQKVVFDIRRGVGHRNIFFADTVETRKFIRNRDQVYSMVDPETLFAPELWAFIHEKNFDCVGIPHHPADEVHTFDWDTRDEQGEPVVEIFQCRGNAEYRGAPRMINLSRHRPSANDKGFVDFALREKKYRLGFVASGDHNSMGVGLACLWVKEVSRKGILEALRQRRCFATTGDKILVDFRVNGAWAGEVIRTDSPPKMTFHISAVDAICKIEILRNSEVVYSYTPKAGSTSEMGEWVDADYKSEPRVLYYYARVIQRNNHIAWSSPVWLNT